MTPKTDIFFYTIFVAAIVALVVTFPAFMKNAEGERYTYCDGARHLYAHHNLPELPAECLTDDTPFKQQYGGN